MQRRQRRCGRSVVPCGPAGALAVLAGRGQRRHCAGDAVLGGGGEQLVQELLELVGGNRLVQDRDRLTGQDCDDGRPGGQPEDLEDLRIGLGIHSGQDQLTAPGVYGGCHEIVDLLARGVRGRCQVDEDRHAGGELDQLLQVTLAGVVQDPAPRRRALG
ncbi:hypothetical protein ACFFX0_00775 [Citricoccus parietis]|uniref:Uncharacterized protein n=1 Tax=Citricoccus parietis TaxID=592307 RepID=A0ABV5FSZ9_9MICC